MRDFYDREHRGRAVVSHGSSFALIELLVVIGIGTVLAGLLVTAFQKAEARAHRIGCVFNLKQFGVGFQLYASDNRDRELGNRDGQDIPLGQTWVEGWSELHDCDCTNIASLQRSLLSRCIGGVTKIWQCSWAEPVTLGRVTLPIVRTLSLNCFTGSPGKTAAARTYNRGHDVIRHSPAEALTFIKERLDTINDGSFAMQWPFEEKQPSRRELRDTPALAHEKSANLAFAVGHVETHRWLDPRTMNAPWDDAPMPNNADVLWLQRRAMSREA